MEAPYFLVALPQLQDDLFARAVVLVGQHDENGAFGLLINKPLVDENNLPTQMVTEVKDPAGKTLFEFHEDIFEGGPVNEGAIFALHTVKELGSEDSEVADDLYLATDPDVFQHLLEEEEYKSKRRFFVGCSSWTAGQLESELRSGSWLPVSFDKKFLFENPRDGEGWTEDFWKRVLIHGGADPLTLMSPSNTDSGYN